MKGRVRMCPASEYSLKKKRKRQAEKGKRENWTDRRTERRGCEMVCF